MMPQGLIPLLTGTALAIAALVLVLSPLLGSDLQSTPGDERSRARDIDTKRNLPGHEKADSAVLALREIEFDRATGKLSDADYADLKERYTALALEELRAGRGTRADNTRVVTHDAHASIPSVGWTGVLTLDDAVEAAIAKARAAQSSCPVCGPRPESDALYCSSCGRYLSVRCPRCGTPVELVASHFCSNCGEQLGALHKPER